MQHSPVKILLRLPSALPALGAFLVCAAALHTSTLAGDKEAPPPPPDAGPLIAAADAIAADGDTAAAVAKYREALKAAITAEQQAVAATGFKKAALAEARNMGLRGDFTGADALLGELLAPDLFPKDPEATALREELKDPDKFNPAMSPAHADKAARVMRMLRNAHDLIDLGDYAAAKSGFNQALSLDPTNTAARRGLEKAEQLISNYMRAARDESRVRMINDVDRQWETQLPPGAVLPLAPTSEAPAELAGGISTRLDSISLPALRLEGTPLKDAVEHLRRKVDEVSPSGGLNFLVQDGENAKDITLNVRNFTLRQALDAISEQSGLRWEPRAAAIVFTARTTGASMVLRTYKVPAGFLTTSAATFGADSGEDPFTANAGAEAKPRIKRLGAKEFLEAQGVEFPPGASASYSPGASQLTVRNTDANQEIVSHYVEGLLASEPRQVRLRILSLSASEVTLKELGVDNILGQFALGNTGVFAGGGTGGNSEIGGTGNSPGNFGNTTFNPILVPFGVTSGLQFGGLRSTFELNKVQTISDLIRISNAGGSVSVENRSPAFFTFGGIFTNPQFQSMIRGVNQKTGMDLGVANDIVFKSGQKANSFNGREFMFPTEFDPPQIPQTVSRGPRIIDLDTLTEVPTNSTGTVPVTPTTPSSFEMKKLGSEIEVEATVGEDGHTVDVNLSVIISEFEGFINYGTPITANGVVLTENRIVQPVFSKTAASAQVTAYDGATIALGGLMESKNESINDKVPLFASIPVIGRLWKSNVVRESRKSLVFFVTVEVLDASGVSRRERAAVETSSVAQ